MHDNSKVLPAQVEDTKIPLLSEEETPGPSLSTDTSATATSTPSVFPQYSLTMAAHVAAFLFFIYIIYIAVPGSTLFSWHPTLMVLAYVAIMFEAVLVFSPHSSLVGSLSRQAKVTCHWLLAVTSVLLAIGGLAVIFQVKENNNKVHFTSWHGLLGLITVGYSFMQLIGGSAVKYYNISSYIIKMRLIDLKMTHAVSGMAAFSLVTATLMCAMYSNWLTERVQGTAWYACGMAVAWAGLVVINQVTMGYAARFVPKNRPNKK